MLELINTIPEELGWMIVGAMIVGCVAFAVKLGKVFFEMWREHREDYSVED